MGYKGVWYTWKRGRFASSNIRERLDRAVANAVWSTTFRLYKVSHFTHSFSNHCPIVVDMEDDGHRNQLWHFKFEAAWLLEEIYKTEVAHLWNDSDGTILERLSYVCCGLDVVLEEMVNAKLQMNMEVDREEIYWEQRAREN